MPNLNLTILLDYHRGTRLNDKNNENSSSKSLLLPLVQNHDASISFYLTPKMSGWRKHLIHPRDKWNELASLHHIKCYIFDNDIIISGANLSDLYFTNRQDRYILFRNCKSLCDYFDQLIKTICTFSMKLNSNGNFQLDSTWKYDPLNYWTKRQFCKEASRRIIEFKKSFYHNKNKLCDLNDNEKRFDTFAIPLLQMKTFSIDDDEKFTSNFLMNIPLSSKVKLATGYFNLTKKYKDILLLRKFENNCDILMASEQANGFYGAKGLPGQIPFVYTDLTLNFFKQSKLMGSSISLYYYLRENWTFHAKGLWLSLTSNNSNYYFTMIGSPNFGFRSIYRDNEAQLLLFTNDNQLKCKLENECVHLWKHSYLITDENQFMHVSFWVKLIARLFKSYY